MQLVDLLDGLLPAMAADPAYAHFMLDGQMAVVDDYLEIRPEAEPVRGWPRPGASPWAPGTSLMDEFLVSGETKIRNLQLGLDRAARFGGAMPVGYLPDMFGHVAQMPQLLAAVRLRPHGRVAGRARRRSTARRSGGRRPTAPGPGRLPPAWLQQRLGPPGDAKELSPRSTTCRASRATGPATRCSG